MAAAGLFSGVALTLSRPTPLVPRVAGDAPERQEPDAHVRQWHGYQRGLARLAEADARLAAKAEAAQPLLDAAAAKRARKAAKRAQQLGQPV